MEGVGGQGREINEREGGRGEVIKNNSGISKVGHLNPSALIIACSISAQAHITCCCTILEYWYLCHCFWRYPSFIGTAHHTRDVPVQYQYP